MTKKHGRTAPLEKRALGLEEYRGVIEAIEKSPPSIHKHRLARSLRYVPLPTIVQAAKKS